MVEVRPIVASWSVVDVVESTTGVPNVGVVPLRLPETVLEFTTELS